MEDLKSMTDSEEKEIRRLILEVLKEVIEDDEAVTILYDQKLNEYRERLLKRIEYKLRKVNG